MEGRALSIDIQREKYIHTDGESCHVLIEHWTPFEIDFRSSITYELATFEMYMYNEHWLLFSLSGIDKVITMSVAR